MINRMTERKRLVVNANWIDRLDRPELRQFLRHQLNDVEILPKGTKMPYFYLSGVTTDIHYEPKDFRDHILLINFWATWCKPCVQQFPYENLLVEKFKDDPVIILNIAVQSDFEKWKDLIVRSQLKTQNLIAQENWSDLLGEKFDIQSLPHSVLIDWQGNIVQNKCASASEGIEKQIEALLAEMKTAQPQTR